MSVVWFKYVLTLVMASITFWLSYLGMKKTNSLESFSLGNKDMGPLIVGITMASSISSTATFVINPGFVYTHGLSALLHYAFAAPLGILAAMVLLSKGFLRHGSKNRSLTIPDWIYSRFNSRPLSLFFSFINLLSITFVVLILVGSSIIVSNLFGISTHLALTLVLLFVFSYVLMGGAYAHAYTNVLQSILMVCVSLFLFFYGFKYLDGGLLNNLSAIEPELAMVFNPKSNLYYDFFSVFFSSFLITFALMLQPHILSKILYLKEDKDVNKFITTCFITTVLFSLILFVGFYAKISGLVIARQDAVMMTFLSQEFSTSAIGQIFLAFIAIALLSAGMSTLDGILVALSAMSVNDIYLPLTGKNRDTLSGEHAQKGLDLSRYVLIFIGLISFAIAWNPPTLVGLFAQKGVYGLAAASFAPILFGVLYSKKISGWIVGTAATIGLFGHLTLNLSGTMVNPSVSSATAMIASFFFMLITILLSKQKE